MENVHGGNIYTGSYRLDFSANLNPLGMPPAVRDAAFEGVKQSVHYPDPDCGALRREIARANGVHPSMVLCGNGAAELIFAICQAAAPKRALLALPGFAEYEQALRMAGCDLHFYTCSGERDFELGEDYLSCMDAETDLAFLCNPANPTGRLINPRLLLKIVERSQKQGIRLIVDECFLPLTRDGDAQSVRELLAGHDRLVLLSAFTKLYAMPGLRLGYLITGDEAFAEQVRAVLQPWNVSLPAQLAGIAALRETAYVEKSRDYLETARPVLTEELEALGLKTVPSSANYIFFRGPQGLTEECARQGILIRDCSNYRGLCEGYYRVAVRTAEENRILIRTLGQILRTDNNKERVSGGR